jgi:hypothetical protein
MTSRDTHGRETAPAKRRVASVRPTKHVIHAEPTPSTITARPKSLADEFEGLEREDQEGLAVSPEQLGTQFLEDAVEEGDNLVSLDERSDLDVTAASLSDQAFTGPNFEANQDVWENTVNFTLQEGAEESYEALDPAPAAVELEDPDPEEFLDLSSPEERDLDLTESSVHEASLFDHEAGELGEVEEPDLITDDTRTHAHLRGGHSPRGRRTRPST